MTGSSIRRRSVVVVHGQGANRVRGGTLAEVVGGIATLLTDCGASIRYETRIAGDVACASLGVTPPAGAPEPEPTLLEFREAYWDDAFPPPAARTSLRWVAGNAVSQVRATIGAWLDPQNAGRGEHLMAVGSTPAALSLAFVVELAIVSVLLVVAMLAAIVVVPVVYVLYVMAETPGLGQVGVFRWLARVLHALDPFLSLVLGDSQRYVDDPVWAANARRVVGEAIAEELSRTDVASVTVIAYSAGAGVAYDTLLAGGGVGAVAGRIGRPPLTLVTLGGAVNRYFLESTRSRTPEGRRFAERPIAASILGTPGQFTFSWTDIYARLDPVPAGRLLEQVEQVSGIDPTQLERRRVVNTDYPLEDHGGYFRNDGLVLPRLVRAIYGYYPWPIEGEVSWTLVRAPRWLSRVASFQAFRLVTVVAFLAHVAALIPRGLGYRASWQDTLRPASDRIVDAIEGLLPAVGAVSPEVTDGLSVALAILGAFVLITVVRDLVRRLVFPDG